MSGIARNILQLKSSIPEGVTLVAVSKTKTVEDIMEAYRAGQRVFGENRVQEIIEKHPLLPSDLRIHMIGHLQTNKVKYIIDKVKMIEGVDSFKLLGVIDREAAKKNLRPDVLLQFHIAEEESKYGFTFGEVMEFHETAAIAEYHNICIRGVMGMATFTDDMIQVRKEFKTLRQYFDILKNKYYSNINAFDQVSMGMSGDYRIAIEEGSTMIRVGSAIFGLRNIP
ncbi:MAG: YggS family pyridoxal phosphate-dependent enzyme [Marinilabiliaceae bacterium]|jgi:pyridoxal phosphate enzyme (YggS family)|nr:YggS family pyridoxal phosphate-dependent enzyme [Marinilabiliaceae bacterium]